MYAFITGTIEEKNNNQIVLSNNGIGYEIFVSNNTIDKLPPLKQVATVFTYMHVREDAQMLFGFINKQEKELFLSLITVSGVGAKTAITILSGINYNDLISAILIEDVSMISKIKGIGKKTAERIVLELKSSLGNLYSDAYELSIASQSSAINSIHDDAVLLLADMGLSKFDALKLVNLVANANDTIEEIIAKALKNMG